MDLEQIGGGGGNEIIQLRKQKSEETQNNGWSGNLKSQNNFNSQNLSLGRTESK